MFIKKLFFVLFLSFYSFFICCIEQEDKIQNESAKTEDHKLLVPEEDKSQFEWYCERKFHLVEESTHYFADIYLPSHFHLHQICDVDQTRKAFLIDENKDRVIKIFDVDLGKFLLQIDSYDETDPPLFFMRLCKLPKNQMACLMNNREGYAKKIKILDVISGKILKEFRVNDFKIEGKRVFDEICIADMVYLSNNKLILNVSDFTDSYTKVDLLILDLNNGKILKKIDFPIDCNMRTKFIERLVIVLPNGNIAFVGGKLLEIDSITYKAKALLEFLGPGRDEVNSIKNVGNKFISTNWLGKIIVWMNDQFNHKEIKEVFYNNNFVISDLQNIILDYVGKEWSIEDGYQSEMHIGKMHILSSDEIIIINNYDVHSFIQQIGIVNLITGKYKRIKFGKKIKELSTLDNGKILIVLEGGLVEIWGNWPVIQEGDLDNFGCILS